MKNSLTEGKNIPLQYESIKSLYQNGVDTWEKHQSKGTDKDAY